jgi:hypothetical protein
MNQLSPPALLQAFESIKHSDPLPATHPLLSLKVVQQRCKKYQRLPSGYRELYATGELLTELILKTLGHSPTKILSESELKQDFQKQNPFIESYSFLYYRYLYTELGLGVQKIAKLTATTPRTLQRRQQEGLQHLLMALLKLELSG